MKKGVSSSKVMLGALAVCLLFTARIATQSVQAARRQLLIISVDGLDYRYLRDADKLGLKIPALRRLMREGEVTEGVVGVVPTVTWPSHTTMITGVDPRFHGILGNRRPQAEGGDYYWDVSLLKAKTLWQAARDAGLKTAAITWPVTVDAAIDYNLPEYFQRRRGGAMDLRSVESKATPGLVEKILKEFPSFGQEWVDDRARAMAAIYLLKSEKPDLLLLHFVDLDAEAHENGPFTREANSVLEYTDELIARILEVAPKQMVVAIVSDHGFERADKVINLPALLKQEGVGGEARAIFGLAATKDKAVAEWLRMASAGGRFGVGREVPQDELKMFAPDLADGSIAFEPAEHHLFGDSAGNMIFTKPSEVGVHGLWPGRTDYAASMVLWGGGVKPARRPRASMLTSAARFAQILGTPLDQTNR